MMFRDRKHAGELLGEKLKELLPQLALGADGHPLRCVVLGLPRGGVPVAHEVSQKLSAPLDVIVVRKLGVPGQEELAMGAVASGGAEYLNEDLIGGMHIERSTVDRILSQKRQEILQRERIFMGKRSHLDLMGACAIIVDDGLATGATMKAAIQAIRTKNPAKIIVAIPVAPKDAALDMRGVADHVVCLTQPEFFFGVGGSYHVFAQTSDEEVASILNAQDLK